VRGDGVRGGVGRAEGRSTGYLTTGALGYAVPVAVGALPSASSRVVASLPGWSPAAHTDDHARAGPPQVRRPAVHSGWHRCPGHSEPRHRRCRFRRTGWSIGRPRLQLHRARWAASCSDGCVQRPVSTTSTLPWFETASRPWDHQCDRRTQITGTRPVRR